MTEDLRHRVARAWAGMDGKGAAFDACRSDPAREETEGYYEGYLADADTLIERAQIKEGPTDG